MDTDLSMADITFLRAVRDINADPNQYTATDEGKVPANKRSIVEATDLNKREVSYRLGGSDSRGFNEGDDAYIISYDPEITENNSFGPRSAELTQAGLDLLTELENDGWSEKGDEPESVKQLRARIDSLENGATVGGEMGGDIGGRLDRIEAELESMKQNSWGAVDERYHDDLNKTVKRLPPMFYLLTEVFELDVDRVAEEAPYDEATLEDVRKSVVEVLGLDDDSMESESSTQNGGGEEDATPSNEPPSFSDLG